jgi:glutamine amidotransferase
VARVRAAVEAEIDPALRRQIRGDTDSERCFLLLLSRLRVRARDPEHPELEEVRAAMAETVATVRRLADASSEKPSSLNLALSNGEVLAVCRHGRTLYAAPHIVHSGVFAVASEAIGEGPWSEVAENGFIGIDADHRVVVKALRLSGRAAA